jgi:hypothetical protein
LVRRHIDPGPSADAPQSIGFVAEHTAVPCTEVLTGGREHFVDGATNWVTMSGPSSFRRLSDPLPVRLITEEGTTVLLRNDNLPRRDVVREPRVRIDPLHSPLDRAFSKTRTCSRSFAGRGFCRKPYSTPTTMSVAITATAA